MNGSIDSQNPSNGCYIGNTPVYRNKHTSNFTPNTSNIYYRYSYAPAIYENNHLQQSNGRNQRYSCILDQKQYQQQQGSTLGQYDFQNGGSTTSSSSSTAYYNRIHAQVRSNVSAFQDKNLSLLSTKFKKSREILPTTKNDQPQQDTSLEPTNKPSQTLSEPQTRIPSPTPLVNCASSSPLRNDDEPSLDYLNYTMDLLIQRLVPNDTYMPQQSFFYPMFMCSRMHIQPNLLLNKFGHLTMNSITNSTHDRNARIMNNFLYILSQWTRTFPYDFRNTEMISQLEEIFRQILSYEPTFQSEIYHINKKLRSKLKALENYEEYIRQINTKALNNVTHTTLMTDIINECPTPILLAQQLTHIELDRLKPIGAEELVQYFIMKSATEEARAHPNRTHGNQTEDSNNKSLDVIYDKKLTFCLETYVQWFNRLTFFVTTEIVKHTQKRLRIRLINYFIDAAYECFRLHNFNSMMGIIGGLNMQPVKRLKRTWEKIQLDKLEQLEHYMNVSKNFANYRLTLKSAIEEAKTNDWARDKIVIPFTSIVLQDVYYIKTHSKDYTVKGGINLKKYYSMANFISEEFVQCKQSKCSFERNDVIINYITTSPTFNENSLMLASFECESAVTPNEKEKWTMLQATVNTSS